ncbi:hypothetical protein MBLNU230_g8578t1 [Neophaeotheca triangularis]
MQYVRNLGGSVSRTWNSINPATLSGAIDVIVVEQEDGSLACSPFHIRFGKFSLLRPYEKKVEFKVNGVKQHFPMKLAEGGEAFFVFETQENVPEALQTSPLVSPATSPGLHPSEPDRPTLQEPDPFELDGSGGDGSHGRDKSKSSPDILHAAGEGRKAQSDIGGKLAPMSSAPSDPEKHVIPSHGPAAKMPQLGRAATDDELPAVKAALNKSFEGSEPFPSTAQERPSSLRTNTDRSASPPPLEKSEAVTRAINLSKKLWTSNIPTQVTDDGDLMLDMTSYKSSDDEALRAEVIARKILSEEIDGPYDIGALIGADEKGNLWIYSSEESKDAAGRKAAQAMGSFNPAAYASTDAISDPGYHSDDTRSEAAGPTGSHYRRDSDSAVGLPSQPSSPTDSNPQPSMGDPNRNYAKTLRLTSDQLQSMDLKPGANTMSFTVNRATCTAHLWYWRHDVPIVISDIDGTITKSDVLGHVLNTLGRDWTHQGVAKLYTDIASNGYNLLYLTSRSVGQADTTRAYLENVTQENGFRLPKGPVILSPDRTIAALRREVYLRKPEIFKMACLRDIMALFSGHGGAEDTHADVYHQTPLPGGLGTGRGRGGSPFYAGFGNRLTDALSYRSVNIPSTRIFTINSNSEVSLDLLSLNKYKTGYASMREIVDHYFPPVGLLVKGGGEEFTDFNYWRERPEEVDFTDSEDEEDRPEEAVTKGWRGKASGRPELKRVDTQLTTLTRETVLSEDEGGEEEMAESYLSAVSGQGRAGSGDGRGSLEGSLLRSLELEREGERREREEARDLLEGEEDDEDDGYEVESYSEDDSEEDSADEALSQGVVRSGPATPEMRATGLEVESRGATPRKAGDLRKGGRGLEPDGSYPASSYTWLIITGSDKVADSYLEPVCSDLAAHAILHALVFAPDSQFFVDFQQILGDGSTYPEKYFVQKLVTDSYEVEVRPVVLPRKIFLLTPGNFKDVVFGLRILLAERKGDLVRASSGALVFRMSGPYPGAGYGGAGNARRSSMRRPSYATVAAGTARSAGPEGLSEHTSGEMDIDGRMDADTSAFGRKWSSELGRYSSHVRQLKERYMEHVRELQESARLDAQQQSSQSISRTSSTTNFVKEMGPSYAHRKVTHAVIERLSPTSESGRAHPLPTRWNSNDKQSGLDILGDGTEIRFNGTTRTSDEAAAVRTDNPMPRECGLYYFEITVLSKGRDGLIGIGFSTSKVSLNRLPGWEQESWAYHGDDGFSFACHASGKAYGPKYGSLDVVGCGINYRTGNAFFTKNGKDLGTAFTGIKTDKLYPSVGMKKPGEHLRANFGKLPFVFDIDGYMAEERKKVFAMMKKEEISSLHPPDDKASLIQKLVGQYLVHEGYVGTARAFTDDLEKRSLNLPRNPGQNPPPAIKVRDEDDVHAINRQKIRRAILDGDIDKALKYTTSYYPNVLEEDCNREVYFKLRCRKFIEMMRTYTEMVAGQQAASPNGHQNPAPEHDISATADGDQDSDQQMDIDDQLHREVTTPTSEANDEQDAMQTSHPSLVKPNTMSSPQSYLTATLTYGRSLETDFAAPDHPNAKSETASLRQLFALIAYRDPYTSPLAGLLSTDGRALLGEQVNGVILMSLGEPAAAALEVVAAQTDTLLGMAGAKGGAGGLVGVRGDVGDLGRRW